MAGKANARKYQFSWDLLGDLTIGRPNLGNRTRVEVYRLMQFTFRDILEDKFGTSVADEIFFEAGNLAGREFFEQFMSEIRDTGTFVKTLQDAFQEYGIGIFRIEQGDEGNNNLVVTVAEDLDCSGLPELEYEVCKYDEGFIAGIMKSFTGKLYDVREIDCGCTGDRTCRFAVDIAE
jgi:predicted hydrocarbon binding protein